VLRVGVANIQVGIGFSSRSGFPVIPAFQSFRFPAVLGILCNWNWNSHCKVRTLKTASAPNICLALPVVKEIAY
jgi:hypothetical protein